MDVNKTTNEEERFFRPNENIHIHMSNEEPKSSNSLGSSKYIRIDYVLSGRASYEIGGKVFNVQKGDMIFVNRGIPFKYSEESGEEYLFYSLYFNHAILMRDPGRSYPSRLLESSFAFYTLNDTERTPYIFFEFSNTSHSLYGELFNKMYMEYRTAQRGYNDAMMAYLTLLVINATRLNESLGNYDKAVYGKQAVEFVLRYINRCYCDHNVSLSGLADRVYLNPDYLGRTFKKETGTTVSEAIQAKRIEHACQSLATTDKPITVIAEECGFNDMNFFYKVFKRRMGVLPGQYRDTTKH